MKCFLSSPVTLKVEDKVETGVLTEVKCGSLQK